MSCLLWDPLKHPKSAAWDRDSCKNLSVMRTQKEIDVDQCHLPTLSFSSFSICPVSKNHCFLSGSVIQFWSQPQGQQKESKASHLRKDLHTGGCGALEEFICAWSLSAGIQCCLETTFFSPSALQSWRSFEFTLSFSCRRQKGPSRTWNETDAYGIVVLKAFFSWVLSFSTQNSPMWAD